MAETSFRRNTGNWQCSVMSSDSVPLPVSNRSKRSTSDNYKPRPRVDNFTGSRRPRRRHLGRPSAKRHSRSGRYRGAVPRKELAGRWAVLAVAGSYFAGFWWQNVTKQNSFCPNFTFRKTMFITTIWLRTRLRFDRRSTPCRLQWDHSTNNATTVGLSGAR